jgi:hypothetical protein
MMPKVCVFCGNRPSGKNREHVIPKWLIALTGKPNRRVYLGRNWSDPNLSQRIFSLGSFTFPSCETCNSKYSLLESRASQVMRSLVALAPASADDLDVLLDWFDKVRVGLWLGLMYLNGNHQNISAQFYIGDRLAGRDRLLFIYRDEGELDGLGITGVESPIFQVMPSCFGLMVNHLHFFNASRQDLLSERIGFPYTTNRQLCREKEGFTADIVVGTGRSALPLVELRIGTGATELYQPMIPSGAPRNEAKHEYDNEFVRTHCVDFASGKGHVLKLDEQRLSKYPEAPSAAWVPPKAVSKLHAFSDVTLMTGEWLDALYADLPGMDNLLPEQVEFINKTSASIRKLHTTMVDHVKKQIESASGVERLNL